MKIHYSANHYVRGIERHTYTLDPSAYNVPLKEALSIVMENLNDPFGVVFELSKEEMDQILQ